MIIRVGVSPKPKVKITTKIPVPESLSGIDNIDIENVKDGHILMYDDQSKRYKFVDPDVFFNKAAENNNVPSNFIDQLDQDLDNRINFDAGQF